MSGRRCSICENPQVSEVNVLLGTGSPVRQVARITGLSRTSLARHREHVQVSGSRLGVLEGQTGPSGPGGPDPLVEAFALAERAQTPRERLRAAEQVRAATRMRLRGVADVDSEDRQLLEANVAKAEALYRDAGDFETAARALSGWREALMQRLQAGSAPRMIRVSTLEVLTSDGQPVRLPGDELRSEHEREVSVEEYFAGVPARLRDHTRYFVSREIRLHFGANRTDETIEVRDRTTDALVWKRPGWSADSRVGESSSEERWTT